ncbi:MAG: hypothetical protein JNL12_04595 [Planctomycetes bacterium]|nr:hypothetical protein [Planctomycetota bacterium]
MAIDRTTSLLLTASLGAAAVVFALLPGAWPNPLPEGELAEPGQAYELRRAAAAVDAACVRGDVDAFVAATTEEHRKAMEQSLSALDRRLEPRTLREIGARTSQARWLDGKALAGEVRGQMAAIAVERPDGAGAQILRFRWDGRQFRFDGAQHAPVVRDQLGAKAAVAATFRRD